MTVEDFSIKSGFKAVSMPNPSKEIQGAYVGDLLSWVMGRAEPGNVWVTIMSNVNVLAVASLADISCVVLAEGTSLDEDALATANVKGINVLSTDLASYETALKISEILK